MDEMERDALVVRWTRHHGLRIPYRKTLGRRGLYEPDFLVELVDGAKELREVKGEHLFSDANTARKLRAGDEFCRRRAMRFSVITKSSVDPDLWRPEERVSVQDAVDAARPALAEDAYVPHRGGCFGTAAVLVALVAAIVVAALAVLR